MRRPLDVAVACAVVGALAYLAYGQPVDPAPTPVPASQRTLAAQVPRAPVVTGTRLWPVAVGVPRGAALVTMRIPRFGADWRWTAVQGVDAASLATGPGHYPSTPLPGATGNTAFAGHRAGHGDPFIDFDLLRPGDRVYLSQGRTTWTYRLTTAPRIIEVTDVWVLDPLPGRQLTLTTCWPKYGSAKRMFVRGTLAGVAVAPVAG